MTYHEAKSQMLGRLNASIEHDCTGFRISQIYDDGKSVKLVIAYLRDNTGVQSLLDALANIGIRVLDMPDFVPCDAFPADVTTVDAEVMK